jgi:hypothetical protein
MWGEQMEKMRAEASEKRRLAEHARRLAGLMHQPEVKKNLTSHAHVLDQLARDLDELVRQQTDASSGPANDP